MIEQIFISNLNFLNCYLEEILLKMKMSRFQYVNWYDYAMPPGNVGNEGEDEEDDDNDNNYDDDDDEDDEDDE